MTPHELTRASRAHADLVSELQTGGTVDQDLVTKGHEERFGFYHFLVGNLAWARGSRGQLGVEADLRIAYARQKPPDPSTSGGDEMATSITYRKGDATAPVGDDTKIICHVCNDVGGWGKGFVLALSKRWPEPEARYRAWYSQGESAGFRLGAVQLVDVAASLMVANMVAQRGVRATAGVPPIRYDALRECLTTLADRATSRGASIHMPRIGCGLAGGSWTDVEAIIEATLLAARVPVHVYDF